MAAFAFDCVGRSDVGLRPNNEDAWYASARLAAVADGVGGAAAGEVASQAMINALIALDKRRLDGPLDQALAEWVDWGNESIGFIAECRPQMAGMSTTLTAVALTNDGSYLVANVGDSRTYLLRDRLLTRLTRDETLVQQLIDRGEISAEDARRHPYRSVVLRALDGNPENEPTLQRVKAQPGDRLLLCSDGLSDNVGDDAIAAALGDLSRGACADHLVELALEAGARDNVSVVIADVVSRAGSSL